MKKRIRKVYETYREYFPILAPALVFDTVILLYISDIPYLNLYARYVILIVLFANWFVLSYIKKFQFRESIKSALALFVVAGLFTLMRLEYYAELLGDLIFVVLLYTIVKEFIFLYAKNKT